MWCCFSSQLQSVEALLSTKGMLGTHFVSGLCRSDVDLSILSGALSCKDTRENVSQKSLYSNIIMMELVLKIKTVKHLGQTPFIIQV